GAPHPSGPRRARARARRHRRAGARGPRGGRRRLHPPGHRDPARPGGRRARPAGPLPVPPGPRGRDGAAHPGQGAGEHGDRPQRHARPVGLDARPRHPLDHVGVGRGLHGPVVEDLPQRHPPHVHERARQGPRPGLLGDARGSRAAVEPGLPPAADLRRAHGDGLRVGHRALRHGARCRPARGEDEGASTQRDGRLRPQGRPPAHEGLRALPAAVGPLAQADAGRHRPGERHPQRVGPHRRLHGPHPGRCRDVHRGAVRGRDARRLVRAAAVGHVQPRGVAAVPRAHRASLLPDRAPPLSRPALQPLREGRPPGPRGLRALRPAVPLRPPRPAVPVRGQEDPAPVAAGRRPEAGPGRVPARAARAHGGTRGGLADRGL
ncbi:MAG: Linoleoyl-CoA desaturase, partial [uncultured Solirubrobacteraceae bacterium]